MIFLLKRSAGWLVPSLISLFVLIGACLAWHHETLVDQHAEQARKLAPRMLHTPATHIGNWYYGENGMAPPDWRGTALSVRWTQINVVPQTPVSDSRVSSWGSWFVGEVGQPLIVKVHASHAASPLLVMPGSGHHAASIVRGAGWSPATVKAVLDSGHPTITSNDDGTATITVTAPLHDRPTVWVWATSSTSVEVPAVTTVNVGEMPWSSVRQVQAWVGDDSVGTGMTKMLIVFVSFMVILLTFWMSEPVGPDPIVLLSDMPPPSSKRSRERR